MKNNDNGSVLELLLWMSPALLCVIIAEIIIIWSALNDY